jgi:hypothetical protein
MGMMRCWPRRPEFPQVLGPWPSTHVGYEIAAAGMMIMAGGHDGKPFDFDDLERWTRVGYERGMRFRKGER